MSSKIQKVKNENPANEPIRKINQSLAIAATDANEYDCLSTEGKRQSIGAILMRALTSLRDRIARLLKEPDLTFEQWEALEKKHSPHSSHHGQIYFRERW